MSENITPLKGFRQAPKPTKGEVQKENETLGQQLAQRLQSVQQFFGNLINQLMRQTKAHEQEITQLSVWLGAADTTDGAAKGDHLVLDYAGVLLNDDGTEATVTVATQEGAKQMPDYFDGGSGKLFMLTNLVGGTLIPGFEEQLLGLKAGEGKVIQVQFPKEYGVESLREKTAKFTVYIHSVKRAYANSPVGDLIDQNTRIREEAKAQKAAYDSWLADTSAKITADLAASEQELAAKGIKLEDLPVTESEEDNYYTRVADENGKMYNKKITKEEFDALEVKSVKSQEEAAPTQTEAAVSDNSLVAEETAQA